MSDKSSARPGRLLRFESLMAAVDSGLNTRSQDLQAALETYETTCDAEYRVATSATGPLVLQDPGSVGTGDMVRYLGEDVGKWGEWVGDVGRGFFAADGDEADLESDSTYTVDTADLEAEVAEHWDDPYRGIEEGAAEQLGIDLLGDDFEYDQDDPPAWHTALDEGGNILDVMEAVTAGLDLADFGMTPAEVQARLRLPYANASVLGKASYWLGRAGNVVAFAGGAAEQWLGDSGMPFWPRAWRSATRGGTMAVGGWAGGAAGGAAAGAVCGPGAPICVPAGMLIGGFGGAFIGDKLADVLPWMDDNELLALDYDLDELNESIATDVNTSLLDYSFTSEEYDLALDMVDGAAVPTWHLEQAEGEPGSTPAPYQQFLDPRDQSNSSITRIDEIDSLSGRPVATTYYLDDTNHYITDPVTGQSLTDSHILHPETGVAIAEPPASPLFIDLTPPPDSHQSYASATMSGDQPILESIQLNMTPSQRDRLGLP